MYSFVDNNSSKNNKISNNIISRKKRNKIEYLKHIKEKKKLLKKKKKNDKNKKDKKEQNQNQQQTEDSQYNFITDSNFKIEYFEQKPDFSKYQNTSEMKQIYDSFIKTIEKQQSKSQIQDIIENEITEDQNEETDQNLEIKNLSKKRQKKLSRMKLSSLKQFSKYPEVVEAWDPTSPDPKLLIHFKCLRNTVPVPSHWAQKNQYLQGRRGQVREPFKLPDFIESTGISHIRNVDDEKKGLKQRLRERMTPKLGRLDIDYQVLHDAFFKYQTKPSLSLHGEVYYENKEFENRMKNFQPGRISLNLRSALGINETSIPPFVANMQRYGPPPAYPNLRIPGVNAPLNDPAAYVTMNLWKEPVVKDNRELVWEFRGGSGHWGEIVEDDDEDNEDNDDIGIEQDGLELSDDGEKPNVKGLFNREIGRLKEGDFDNGD
jgi:splicing factor 3B subunit 2